MHILVVGTFWLSISSLNRGILNAANYALLLGIGVKWRGQHMSWHPSVASYACEVGKLDTTGLMSTQICGSLRASGFEPSSYHGPTAHIFIDMFYQYTQRRPVPKMVWKEWLYTLQDKSWAQFRLFPICQNDRKFDMARGFVCLLNFSIAIIFV